MLVLFKHTHTDTKKGQKHHLDVEFQVFVHCKDVVENVLGDARDDAHLVRVVQLALERKITVTNGRRTAIAVKKEKNCI